MFVEMDDGHKYTFGEHPEMPWKKRPRFASGFFDGIVALGIIRLLLTAGTLAAAAYLLSR